MGRSSNTRIEQTEKTDVDSNCLGTIKVKNVFITTRPAIIFKLNSKKREKTNIRRRQHNDHFQFVSKFSSEIWRKKGNIKSVLVWAAVIYRVFQSTKLRRHKPRSDKRVQNDEFVHWQSDRCCTNDADHQQKNDDRQRSQQQQHNQSHTPQSVYD